jgi:hypothetical protein
MRGMTRKPYLFDVFGEGWALLPRSFLPDKLISPRPFRSRFPKPLEVQESIGRVAAVGFLWR